MRLDPKYFNRFIAICAVLTVIVIIYSTIRYSQKQVTGFQQNIEAVQLDTLAFRSYTAADSLKLRDIHDPVVIQFWSTWSGRSLAVNRFLEEFSVMYPELQIIAAVVRDADDLILEYIEEQQHPFHYVEGTQLFQSVYIPGVPSQILIDRNGNLFATQVGDDTDALEQKLLNMLAE